MSVLGGHPGRDRSHRFIEVERLEGGRWVTVSDDDADDTLFRWEKVRDASVLHMTWESSPVTPAGSYRIVHRGRWKASAFSPEQAYRVASAPFRLGS
jgi:neutral ceramidase